MFRDGDKLAGRSEADIYYALGLPLIPPELLEDRGELAAAERGALPRLIELIDLRIDHGLDADRLLRQLDEIDLLDFGIGQARRGWLEAADVLNRRSLAQLRRLLR